MSTKDTCWKNRPHVYVAINKTSTHIVKRCTYCKGKKWIPIRDTGATREVAQVIVRC